MTIFEKFKNLPHGRRTAIMVIGLLVLWFSGIFSVVSIGLGSWLLWNWWRKKSANKNSKPKFFQSSPQVNQQKQAVMPSPIQPPKPQQNSSSGPRPTIRWRKKPKV